MNPDAGAPPTRAGTGKSGLAVASLALGILGLAGSAILAGVFLALAGLILGGIHLALGGRNRRIAWSGVGFSVAAIVATLGFGAFYLAGLRPTDPPGDQSLASDYERWIGQPAPPLELSSIDGAPFRLAGFRGRRVVIDVWSTECAPCVREIPHLVELRRSVPVADLEVVGLSHEERPAIESFRAAHPVNFPLVSAGGTRLPDPFAGVRTFPTTFFIDREGRFEDIAVGYLEFGELRRRATASDRATPVPGLASRKAR